MRSSRIQLAALAMIILGPSWVSAQSLISFTFPIPLNDNAEIDDGEDKRPRLATDGLGNWLAVWDSDDDLNGTLPGGDRDIFVARSTDNGATWNTPIALNTNAALDDGDDLAPDIATDGAGNWVVAWESNDDLNGALNGTDKDIFVSRSTNNGATWTAPIPLNTNAETDFGDDASPRIDTDGVGIWVTVWQSNDSLAGAIDTDGDILVSTSTNNGATWTAPEALNTNAGIDIGADTFPNIANDGAGNWVAVWQSTENLGGAIDTEGDILTARSNDDAANWSAPIVLNTNAAGDSGLDQQVDIATDAAGVWLAVWSAQEVFDIDADILLARSVDNGASWTAPGALNANAGTDNGEDTKPRIVTDTLGNWVAAWESTDNLDGTIGTDSDIVAARSTDNGTNWSAPQALNVNANSDFGGDFAPDLATDGAGNWVAVWDSVDTLGGTTGTDSDIFSARFVIVPPTCVGAGCSPPPIVCGTCGAGLAPLMPLLLAGWMLRTRRR